MKRISDFTEFQNIERIGCNVVQRPEDVKINTTSQISQESIYTRLPNTSYSTPLLEFQKFVRSRKDIDYSTEMDELEKSTPRDQRSIYNPPVKGLDRYYNVLTYNSTRVKISVSENEKMLDYINASHISKCPNGSVSYIAAQAPPAAAFDSFWRMILEQRTAVVLMLTKLKESEREKASKYWPEYHQGGKLYGTVFVRPLADPVKEHDATIRTFELFTSGSTKEDVPANCLKITHISYDGWPDFGVPKEFSSFSFLFSLYRNIRQNYTDTPVLLHCSAGIGRTGTFIVIDQIVDQVEASGKDPNFPINVFNMLWALRQQRHGMVQTSDQFSFIYQFLNHWFRQHKYIVC